MYFDFDCWRCGATNEVWCPDVGFWGHRYEAPAVFWCWRCDEECEPD
ncbi:hypothetical protein [Streptomyces sp. AcH 505]